MKRVILPLAAAVALFTFSDSLFAQSSGKGSQWFQLQNRLRLEYDDNVYQTSENEEDSFKVIEELELFFNLYLDQTFFSLRYRPQFLYWDNREGDDTDFAHDVDFVFNHAFSPRVSLNIKDTFRMGENPAVIENGVIVQEKDDFLYNSANGTLGFLVTPETRLEAAGRHVLLQYDDATVAEREDYTSEILGLSLRQQVVPETAILGEFRYELIEYDENDRGSDGIQAGLGIDHTFNPEALGNFRVGYQAKSYEDAVTEDNDHPYFDAGLTFLPSPATRISTGAGYSMRETEVYPYTNQDRLSILASLAHDFTARLALYVSATYFQSDLSGDEVLASEGLQEDGEETGIQLSSKLSYRINRSNTIEASWQLVDLDTDVREDYVRNRVSVGWKTEL